LPTGLSFLSIAPIINSSCFDLTVAAFPYLDDSQVFLRSVVAAMNEVLEDVFWFGFALVALFTAMSPLIAWCLQ
jgi:hypothetical protein